MFTSIYGFFKPNLADLSDMEWATGFPGAMARTLAPFKIKG